jgi:SRP-independent targeting protein 2/TMEM208
LFVLVARKDAAATYVPLLLGINVLHGLLFLGTSQNYFHVWTMIGMISVMGLQYLALQGILDSAAAAPRRQPKDHQKALVGGSWLDLLGLTVVVQFGSVLWTPRFYWLLLLVPMGGAWTLYSTFFRGTGAGTSQSTTTSPLEDQPTQKTTRKEKQQQQQPRSEKRRQKKTS